jgi:IclR family KDG regulon transcriptional repressor
MKKVNQYSKNRSLERALQIICAFTFETKKLTLTELSNTLGLHMTTTYRLAQTLLDYGFLEFDEVTKQYSLGLKLMEIGSIVFNSFSIGKVASPALNELLAKVGNKNVVLAIFRNDEIVYIAKKEDPRNPIQFATTEVGRHRPPYFGMFGLLFLAFMPEGEVERILKKNPLTAFTNKSILDVNQFKAKLGEVRQEGYALDDGMAFEGLSGLAVPIWNHEGRVVAGVGISFITKVVDNEELEYLIECAKEVARKIEKRLPTVKPPVKMNSPRCKQRGIPS